MHGKVFQKKNIFTSVERYFPRKNENNDWAEVTFGTIDSVTYAISGLRGRRLPGSERRCRVDYAFTQEGAEKIGTFSSLSAYHERRARESGSLRELHSALGDCWEGEIDIKKTPISGKIILYIEKLNLHPPRIKGRATNFGAGQDGRQFFKIRFS